MSKKEKSKNSYTAKDIYVLEGLEPVRKRPGMYIGSTGTDGLHHLIWEVVDNSIDEAMSGFADFIEVILLPGNQVSVVDNGRGIPVETHKQTKVSALETVMVTLHAGGKFGGESYKVSGGLHGVGVSVVNALSQWLQVEVRRDGWLYKQEYKKGAVLYKVKKIKPCKGTGTAVIFDPDPEIFKDRDFSWQKIVDHLRQQAYLTKKIKIAIKDERERDNRKCHNFYFDGGIVSYIRYLNKGEEPRHDNIFYIEKEKEGIIVEVALQYVDDLQEREISFANNIHTIEGGMHLTGFRTAITRTLNDYAKKNGFLKESEDNFSGEDIREGLTAIVSIKLREPQFEGQTKAKLGNVEARSATEVVMGEAFTEFLEKNPNDARAIISKCLLSQKARKAAKAAKDVIIRKGALEGMTLPGKLADCSNRDPAESELFIVEGESAGGSAKQGRDRKIQAILPLKGKILNVEKARLDRMLDSKEIRALIIAIGAGIQDSFDIEKIRYHRIIIMSDADVDGAHIKTLILTLFFRYFPQIIEKGYLYIAHPPLFRVQSGKMAQYAFSDEEKDKIVGDFLKIKSEKSVEGKKVSQKNKKSKDMEVIEEAEAAAEENNGTEENTGGGEEQLKGIVIQRYKGLGEMNAEQLWETTLNPATRVLKQVMIEDNEAANKIFDVLMGPEVAPRKRFIQTHAKKVTNLDV
ncbi:MAG: DNA gyrase subunit B [Parcubacteria group bacterium GW2011_GWA2_38_13b]|nr:MAG: DNA gyrase subunit B [Parcubacteria group bacterium GW2011_GWA2_38_13b]